MRSLLVVTVLYVLWSAPVVAARADEAPCPVLIDRIQAGAHALQSDAGNMGMSFVHAEPLNAALGAAVNALETNVGDESPKSPTTGRDELESWRKRVRTWAADLKSLDTCFENERACASAKVLAKTSAEIRDWVASLRARKKVVPAFVAKAASVFGHYEQRLEGTDQGNAGAAAACLVP
jgi:hypothetical protein